MQSPQSQDIESVDQDPRTAPIGRNEAHYPRLVAVDDVAPSPADGLGPLGLPLTGRLPAASRAPSAKEITHSVTSPPGATKSSSAAPWRLPPLRQSAESEAA